MPIALIITNYNYVFALTPDENTSKEIKYLELKQKINPFLEIDSVEKRLGKNKHYGQKKLVKIIKIINI